MLPFVYVALIHVVGFHSSFYPPFTFFLVVLPKKIQRSIILGMIKYKNYMRRNISSLRTTCENCTWLILGITM